MKFLVALLIYCLSIGSLSAQGYHISGSQIYDGNNTAVVFKGTNVNGPNWVWPRETTQDVNLIMNDWKFNIVRVNCVLYGSNYTTNNNYDNIVNTFTSRGAIVILEVHDFTGKEPTDAQLTDLKNFWIDKANRYKGNSSVWFNIENEPVDGWDGSVTLTTRWRDVHDAVIGAVRGTGANNIVICDDNGWGSGGWQASTSGILTYGTFLTSKYSNVAFGLHFYDDRHTQTEYTNWISSIVAKGLCPIVGEFGIDGGGPSPLTPGLLLNALNSSNQLKMITRLSWAWAGGDNNDYCSSGGDGTGGGYNINKTDGTKPTNLSAFGSLIWDDNHTTSGSNVSVTGVSVSPTSISLAVSASSQLTATVSPANATNKSVNWSSSNTSVATVSTSGLVTGVAAGSATITVTTVDGAKTSTSAITVTSTGAGVLSGSLNAASGNYNLTTVGTADWINWGRGGTYANVDRKSGGTLINSLANVGSGESHGGWTDPKFSTSWTNGSPTASGTNDQGYVWSNGALNSGLSFTVKADGTAQTLYVLCGLNGVAATLTAHLSDNSATDYVNAQSSSGSGATLYKINFQAQSANQTLTITLLKTSNITGTNGSVDLKAAWVVSGFSANAVIATDKSLSIYPTAFDANVYPNPVTSDSYLVIHSAVACQVSVRVINVNGNLIYTKKLDVSGVMRMPLDFFGLQKGTFFIQIQNKNQTITKRLIKLE